MLLPLLVVTSIALALVLRARGGRRSPDRLERFYLMAAPLPIVLVLVVPGVVGLTLGFDGHNRGWINRANWGGVGLSIVLLLAGVALIVRAVRGRRAWGWPLAGGVIVAAVPTAIVVMSYALWTLARLLIR
jgi:hypothetical protein